MPNKIPKPTTDLSAAVRKELPKFVERINVMRQAYYKQMEFDNYYKPCRIGGGRKYIKIVFEDTNGGRVHDSTYCFVRLADGAILKSENGVKPALNNIRGYIFNRDVSLSCDWHGAKYMDRL